MRAEPFRVAVPDALLDDLRERLPLRSSAPRWARSASTSSTCAGRRRCGYRAIQGTKPERFYNVVRWTPMRAGGHFAAMEEPAALVDDVRAFFRPLR